MNTLIELYDERAIENILAPDMFRPGASSTSAPVRSPRTAPGRRPWPPFSGGGAGSRS